MHLPILLFSFLSFLACTATGAPPSKIYGVNLGSWLLLEPWMLPQEWVRMGGQVCNDCSTCIGSEFALAAAYPDDVDQRFARHWSTWFTQNDVDRLREAKLNTVRIPLGYWIVEGLVDRKTEHYPRGGLKYLINGLDMLRNAGIQAILDHHALPGAQAVNQMFAGNCTSTPQFYVFLLYLPDPLVSAMNKTDYNYGRALTWTAFMTYLSHCHPSFENVFAIEAVNEPLMNATQTPGLGEFYKNFVKTVRLVEWFLQEKLPEFQATKVAPTIEDLHEILVAPSTGTMDWPGLPLPVPVIEAFVDAFPMLLDAAEELNWHINTCLSQDLSPITTNFMDVLWQYNNPPNPADAADGPQAYDHHLYYRLGVADPNPEAYLQNLCNRNDTQRDAVMGNSPMWVGEWAISTNFNATDEFIHKWADAQKLRYSESTGWLFWSFKLEATNPLGHQWSYFEGLDRGYLTLDPSQYHDPNVCAPYLNPPANSSNPS